MQFVIVDPGKRSVRAALHEDLRDALIDAGLNPGAVDHGSLSRRIGYVVYEYGLYVPPAEQHYFGVAGHLIAGACVLYGVGEGGDTVDLMRSQIPDVQFFLGVNDVEAAIERGEVKRPIVGVNGVTFWQWPGPAPAGMMR